MQVAKTETKGEPEPVEEDLIVPELVEGPRRPPPRKPQDDDDSLPEIDEPLILPDEVKKVDAPRSPSPRPVDEEPIVPEQDKPAEAPKAAEPPLSETLPPLSDEVVISFDFPIEYMPGGDLTQIKEEKGESFVDAESLRVSEGEVESLSDPESASEASEFVVETPEEKRVKDSSAWIVDEEELTEHFEEVETVTQVIEKKEIHMSQEFTPETMSIDTLESLDEEQIETAKSKKVSPETKKKATDASVWVFDDEEITEHFQEVEEYTEVIQTKEVELEKKELHVSQEFTPETMSIDTLESFDEEQLETAESKKVSPEAKKKATDSSVWVFDEDELTEHFQEVEEYTQVIETKKAELVKKELHVSQEFTPETMSTDTLESLDVEDVESAEVKKVSPEAKKKATDASVWVFDEDELTEHFQEVEEYTQVIETKKVELVKKELHVSQEFTQEAISEEKLDSLDSVDAKTVEVIEVELEQKKLATEEALWIHDEDELNEHFKEVEEFKEIIKVEAEPIILEPIELHVSEGEVESLPEAEVIEAAEAVIESKPAKPVKDESVWVYHDDDELNEHYEEVTEYIKTFTLKEYEEHKKRAKLEYSAEYEVWETKEEVSEVAFDSLPEHIQAQVLAEGKVTTQVITKVKPGVSKVVKEEIVEKGKDVEHKLVEEEKEITERKPKLDLPKPIIDEPDKDQFYQQTVSETTRGTSTTEITEETEELDLDALLAKAESEGRKGSRTVEEDFDSIVARAQGDLASSVLTDILPADIKDKLGKDVVGKTVTIQRDTQQARDDSPTFKMTDIPSDSLDDLLDQQGQTVTVTRSMDQPGKTVTITRSMDQPGKTVTITRSQTVGPVLVEKSQKEGTSGKTETVVKEVTIQKAAQQARDDSPTLKMTDIPSDSLDDLLAQQGQTVTITKSMDQPGETVTITKSMDQPGKTVTITQTIGPVLVEKSQKEGTSEKTETVTKEVTVMKTAQQARDDSPTLKMSDIPTETLEMVADSGLEQFSIQRSEVISVERSPLLKSVDSGAELTLPTAQIPVETLEEFVSQDVAMKQSELKVQEIVEEVKTETTEVIAEETGEIKIPTTEPVTAELGEQFPVEMAEQMASEITEQAISVIREQLKATVSENVTLESTQEVQSETSKRSSAEITEKMTATLMEQVASEHREEVTGELAKQVTLSSEQVRAEVSEQLAAETLDRVKPDVTEQAISKASEQQATADIMEQVTTVDTEQLTGDVTEVSAKVTAQATSKTTLQETGQVTETVGMDTTEMVSAEPVELATTNITGEQSTADTMETALADSTEEMPTGASEESKPEVHEQYRSHVTEEGLSKIGQEDVLSVGRSVSTPRPASVASIVTEDVSSEAADQADRDSPEKSTADVTEVYNQATQQATGPDRNTQTIVEVIEEICLETVEEIVEERTAPKPEPKPEPEPEPNSEPKSESKPEETKDKPSAKDVQTQEQTKTEKREETKTTEEEVRVHVSQDTLEPSKPVSPEHVEMLDESETTSAAVSFSTVTQGQELLTPKPKPEPEPELTKQEEQLITETTSEVTEIVHTTEKMADQVAQQVVSEATIEATDKLTETKEVIEQISETVVETKAEPVEKVPTEPETVDVTTEITEISETISKEVLQEATKEIAESVCKIEEESTVKEEVSEKVSIEQETWAESEEEIEFSIPVEVIEESGEVKKDATEVIEISKEITEISETMSKKVIEEATQEMCARIPKVEETTIEDEKVTETVSVETEAQAEITKEVEVSIPEDVIKEKIETDVTEVVEVSKEITEVSETISKQVIEEATKEITEHVEEKSVVKEETVSEETIVQAAEESIGTEEEMEITVPVEVVDEKEEVHKEDSRTEVSEEITEISEKMSKQVIEEAKEEIKVRVAKEEEKIVEEVITEDIKKTEEVLVEQAPVEQLEETKVVEQAPVEQLEETKVVEQAPVEQFEETKVVEQAAIEQLDETKVVEQAPIEQLDETKVVDQAPVEQLEETKVVEQAPVEQMEETKVVDQAPIDQLDESKVVEQALVEQFEETKVVEQAPIEQLDETKVVDQAPEEKLEETKVVEQAPVEQLEETKVVEQAPVEQLEETKVVEQAQIEQLEETKVVEQAPEEKLEETKVVEQAPIDQLDETKVVEQAPVEIFEETKVIQQAPVVEFGESELVQQVPVEQFEEQFYQTTFESKSQSYERVQEQVLEEPKVELSELKEVEGEVVSEGRIDPITSRRVSVSSRATEQTREVVAEVPEEVIDRALSPVEAEVPKEEAVPHELKTVTKTNDRVSMQASEMEEKVDVDTHIEEVTELTIEEVSAEVQEKAVRDVKVDKAPKVAQRSSEVSHEVPVETTDERASTPILEAPETITEVVLSEPTSVKHPTPGMTQPLSEEIKPEDVADLTETLMEELPENIVSSEFEAKAVQVRDRINSMAGETLEDVKPEDTEEVTEIVVMDEAPETITKVDLETKEAVSVQDRVARRTSIVQETVTVHATEDVDQDMSEEWLEEKLVMGPEIKKALRQPKVYPQAAPVKLDVKEEQAEKVVIYRDIERVKDKVVKGSDRSRAKRHSVEMQLHIPRDITQALDCLDTMDSETVDIRDQVDDRELHQVDDMSIWVHETDEVSDYKIDERTKVIKIKEAPVVKKTDQLMQDLESLRQKQKSMEEASVELAVSIEKEANVETSVTRTTQVSGEASADLTLRESQGTEAIEKAREDLVDEGISSVSETITTEERSITQTKRLDESVDVSQKLVVESEVSKQERVDVSESHDTESEISKKLFTESEASKRLTAELEASKKLVTESEVSQKLVTESEVSQKLVTESEVSQKLVTESEVSQKLVTEAEASRKVVTESEVSKKLTLDSEVSQKQQASATTKVDETMTWESAVKVESAPPLELSPEPSKTPEPSPPKTGEEPKVILALRHVMVKQGETAHFECHFSGTPEPDMSWFHGGTRITESERVITSTTFDGHQVVVVQRASAEHSGEYTCRATSDEGMAETSAYLTVLPGVWGSQKLRREKIHSLNLYVISLDTISQSYSILYLKIIIRKLSEKKRILVLTEILS